MLIAAPLPIEIPSNAPVTAPVKSVTEATEASAFKPKVTSSSPEISKLFLPKVKLPTESVFTIALFRISPANVTLPPTLPSVTSFSEIPISTSVSPEIVTVLSFTVLNFVKSPSAVPSKSLNAFTAPLLIPNVTPLSSVIVYAVEPKLITPPLKLSVTADVALPIDSSTAPSFKPEIFSTAVPFSLPVIIIDSSPVTLIVSPFTANAVVKLSVKVSVSSSPEIPESTLPAPIAVIVASSLSFAEKLFSFTVKFCNAPVISPVKSEIVLFSASTTKSAVIFAVAYSTSPSFTVAPVKSAAIFAAVPETEIVISDALTPLVCPSFVSVYCGVSSMSRVNVP